MRNIVQVRNRFKRQVLAILACTCFEFFLFTNNAIIVSNCKVSVKHLMKHIFFYKERPLYEEKYILYEELPLYLHGFVLGIFCKGVRSKKEVNRRRECGEIAVWIFGKS